MIRRVTGILMLGLEAVLLWRTMGYLPVASLAILVALLGCWPRLHVSWRPRSRYLASALVGFVYLAWWWLDLQYLEPSRSAQFGNSVSLAAALCLMMVQAILYYWRAPEGLPASFPFLGIVALAFASDHYLSQPVEFTIAFSASMIFGLLMAIYFAVDRHGSTTTQPRFRARKYALLALCFALSFVLAGGTAWVIGRSDKVVGQWLVKRNLLKNQLVLGNRQSARLGSMTDIKGANFDHIALQIVADKSPGYLRGQVYGTYRENTWGALGQGEKPEPVAEGPADYAPEWRGERLFPVIPDAGGLDASLVVYPDPAIDRALFAPMETGWVGLPGGAVSVNEAHVVQAAQALDGQAYQLLTTPAAPIEALAPEQRSLYTGLPAGLAPRLMALASRICEGQSTTLGKANAITQYFTSNYDYALGIQVPKGMDPMEYFLFSDPLPDAHCEYFATGAALLLRAAGVPARYVTGVGVWERHPFADYWVARNRDAHAWVEAWDEKEGWFIVEATPASGLPDAMEGQGTSASRDFMSMLRLQLRRLITALREGAWPTVAGVLTAMLAGVATLIRSNGWALAPLAGALFLLWLLRRWWRARRLAVAPSEDGRKRKMAAQLTQMDRWVRKRHRQTRPAHVTAHAFARTLELARPEDGAARNAAQWYRRWAAIRYRLHLDEAAIVALDSALHEVRQGKGAESEVGGDVAER